MSPEEILKTIEEKNIQVGPVISRGFLRGHRLLFPVGGVLAGTWYAAYFWGSAGASRDGNVHRPAL